MSITVAMRTQVSQLYVSLFGRAPDGEGLGYWVGQLAGGKTVAEVAQDMFNVSAARAYYPSFMTNDEIVAAFYVNVLGRAADAEGQAYWVGKMNAVGATKGSVINDLINAVVNYAGTDAAGVKSKALFTNKVEVAQYYGEKSGNVAGATAVLAGVTDAAATVTAAKAIADGAANPGQTFMLTAGVDTFTGGTGADTVNATHLTLNASDVLVGGAGTDTLKIIDSGSAAFTVPAARVSGFETISIQNINSVPAVAAVTGVNEAATVQFRDLAAGQTVTIAGITFTAGSSGATAAQVAAAYTTATPTTSNSTTIAVVAGGQITGPTFTTVSNDNSTTARATINTALSTAGYVASAGTAVVNSAVFTATTNTNVMDLVATGSAVTGRSQVVTMTATTAATAAMAITINGVSVPAADGADLTADAASLAAAINAYLGYTAATSSAGVITVTTPTTVNFGTATGTALVISNALTTAYAAPAAPTITIAPHVAAVTAVAAASTGDTVTVTNFTDATSFVSDASTGAVTFSGDLTATQSVTLNGNGALSVGGLTATFGAAATSPVFNITGGTRGSATNTINVGANTTNVTVNSSGAANTVGALTVVGGRADSTLSVNAASNLTTGTVTSDAKNLNVSGAATAVTLGTLTMGNLTTIDASGLTAGGVVLTLPTTATSFKGGQGADTVTTATIASTATIDGGAGTDILVLAADITSAAVGAQYTNFDTLRVKAAATQNVALVPGITAVQLQSGNNAITGLNATQAAAVTARADIGTGSFALTDSTGTADVFSMTLGTGLTDTEATDTGVLTLTGFETINLRAAPGVASAAGSVRVSTIAGFDAISANTINLTGTAFDITTLTNQTGTRAKVLTVDGSALVGDGAPDSVGLTAAGNIFAGSTVIGSATAGNNFTLGTEINVTYTGGAGKDSFTGTEAQITATTISGGAGEDTLVIADGADTIANATFAKVTGMEKLTLNEVAALSLTTGTAFNTAFTAGTATITATALDASAVTTIDTSAYTGNATLTVSTLADTEATTLTTGAGNDTVTFTGRNTTGLTTIATGEGNDTIAITQTTGTLATNTTFKVTPGTGADTVSLTLTTRANSLNNVELVITAGDSTAAGFDKITGFAKSGGSNVTSDLLNFSGAAIKPVDGFAATTVAGFTAAQLQVSASTAGLLTFTGTSASSLTEAQLIAAYTSTIDAKLNNLETVVFSTATDTYVFNNNALGDSVVMLVGLTGVTAVGASADTNHLIAIA